MGEKAAACSWMAYERTLANFSRTRYSRRRTLLSPHASMILLGVVADGFLPGDCDATDQPNFRAAYDAAAPPPYDAPVTDGGYAALHASPQQPGGSVAFAAAYTNGGST